MKKISLLGFSLLVFGLLVIPAYLGNGEEPIEEWAVSFDLASWYDNVSGIAVDFSGNVFVAGYSTMSRDIPFDEVFTTIKYDSNGNEEWVRVYNYPESGEYSGLDRVSGIAIDDLGNVYITGFSWSGWPHEGGTQHDIVTIKYDTLGEELWIRRYNGPSGSSDYGFDIAVDSAANVYVVGGSEGDYFTIKYDTNGEQKWIANYGGTLHDRAYAIDVYEQNEEVYIYVLGYETGASSLKCSTVKYDNNGNQLWTNTCDFSPGNFDEPKAIAVDSAGNVFVAYSGFYGYGGQCSKDIVTIKYDVNGNEDWVRCYDGPLNCDDWIFAIDVDSSGNVFVAGRTDVAFTQYGHTTWDWVIIKYDSAGQVGWIRTYDATSELDDTDSAYDIALDSEGNVYVTGNSYLGFGVGNFCTTKKYDNDGNELWTILSDKKNTIPYHMVLDSEGNVYVAGYVASTAPGSDLYTIKYRQKLTPEEQILELIDEVERLANEGKINPNKTNGMIRKLEEALNALERGNERVACNKLHDFIDQVNAAINADPLTEEEGQALIDAANEVINELCG